MKSIAIIPARGGSKRIPRKNVKEFCGKPVMAYSIEAALKSGIFDEVMVSTDDEEIAAIARQYGASVPFMRSEANSGDHTPIGEVVYEVLSEYEKRGRSFDYAFCIYAACPLITEEILRGVWQMMQDNPTVDGVTTMVPFEYPPQRSIHTAENGTYAWMYPEYARSRCQDMELCYHDAGMCQVRWADLYLGRRSWVGSLPYLLPLTYAQDIDTEEDWEIAEFKYQYLKSKGRI